MEITLPTYEDSVPEEPVLTPKLIVRDLPDGVDEDFLEVFFEKPKFGSNRVQSVELDEEAASAVITFEDPCCEYEK